MGRYHTALGKNKVKKKKKKRTESKLKPVPEFAQRKRKGINADSGEVLTPTDQGQLTAETQAHADLVSMHGVRGQSNSSSNLATHARITAQQQAGRQITNAYEQTEIDRDLEQLAQPVIDNGAVIIQTNGPRSRCFTLISPNGYRITIPIRRLNIRRNDAEIAITVGDSVAQAVMDDVWDAQRRYGI